MKRKITLFFLIGLLIVRSSNWRKSKNVYHKQLKNRRFWYPLSALAGIGMTYLLCKNDFLSSLRAAEKIKHDSYFKFVWRLPGLDLDYINCLKSNLKKRMNVHH